MNLPVKAGDLVGGKYVIQALLGAGGMGAVFLATQEQLRRQVAVKFLLSEAMANPDAFARFEREAHAAAALQSDYVTRVLDMGALPGGTPYIVMEYLEGEDLATKLETQGVLTPQQAVAFVVEACDAISEAHALGIIHRDLKPANLFLARRANGATRIKVLDFGISKMTVQGKPMSLTDTGAVMGSPLYMSPEQLRGSGRVDERTDIWALGVVLYELLAGQPPFMAEAFPEQCALILTAPVPPLHERRPDVPAPLEAVVMRCLAKNASDRFVSVSELTAALLAVVPNATLGPGSLSASYNHGVLAPLPEAARSGPTLPLVTPSVNQRYGNVTAGPFSTSPVDGPPFYSRRWVGVAVAVAACAAGVALGAFYVMRPHSDGAVIVAAPPPPRVAVGGQESPAPGRPPLPSAIPPPPPVQPEQTTAARVAGAPAATPAATPAAEGHAAAPATTPRRGHGRGRAASPPAADPEPSPAVAPAPPPAAAPAPAPPPAPAHKAPDCSTPYFFDAQGNKVFKPECL